ncbi:uncharacterized protein LOC112539247 [Tetranychus urticae]|uniref:Uncharacterized protein n=1 Tax=Tetranychus urticae TaxID=32264 RepID=T1KP92_TETUR|nr:uncharacterized protein LOC112539247 [Tetranychus urticae]
MSGSNSTNVTNSAGGVKRKKKILSSTPKKNVTQPLMAFCTSNSVPTVIKKSASSLNSTPDIQITDEHSFLFLLGTKSDLRYIQPIIIRVSDTLFQSREFIRCRIDNSNYVGKVISISKNLTAIQNEAEKLCVKISTGFRSHIIKKDQMILCCTKVVRIFETSDDDERKAFLIQILPSMEEFIQEDIHADETGPDLSKECQMEIPDSGMNGDSASNIDQDIDSNDEADEFMSENHSDTHPSSQNNAVSIQHDSGLLYDISSGSDCEFEQEDSIKKKRRKRQYTDCKLLTKFREEKKQQAEKANAGIVLLMDILENSIPALPIENPITPTIKNIYQFCLHLNTKFNHMNEKNLLENSIEFTRKIKVHKVKDKDEINLNGMIFPFPDYTWAIKADEPRLVMSRLIRGCIPDEMKDDCQVNDKADNSNFLFRIGDSKLEGNERLANGREKIEMLIEHSHAVKKLDKMSYQSYRECKAQVDKALYDFARKKLKKKDGKDKNVKIPIGMNETDRSNENPNSSNKESSNVNRNSITKESSTVQSGKESQVRYLINNFLGSS